MVAKVSARGRQRSQAALGASGCAEGGARPSARRLRRAWQLDHLRGHPGGSVCLPVDWGPSCFMLIVHLLSHASCFVAIHKGLGGLSEGNEIPINYSIHLNDIEMSSGLFSQTKREKS